MKRILHYFKVRRRAKRIRQFAENAATSLQSPVMRKDLYNDDGDLGYC